MPELDGVRGIAIAGVMALHFCGGVTPTNGLERALVKVSSYGLWGVDLFFVLSGFLITGILLETKQSPRYFRDFYIRRTLRIFPLYYGVLFIMCVIVPSGILAWLDPQLVEMRRVQGWLWLYSTNFYLGAKETWQIPYLSHFWSLAVEEHFYLAWPLLILVSTRRTAMRVCIACGLFSLALRIAFSLATPNLLYAHTVTPCRLDALCAGGWFALSARGDDALAPERAIQWIGVYAAAVLALSEWHSTLQLGDALVLPLRTTLLAVLFGLFIYASAQHSGLKPVRSALRASWLRSLGKYSYGLYVFHGIVSYGIDRYSPEAFLSRVVGVHLVAAALQVAFGVTLSLLLAVASYELFEVRFLRLKKHFDYAPVVREALSGRAGERALASVR